MKKFWMLYGPGSGSSTKQHNSFEAAEQEAQRLITQKGLNAVAILEAVAIVHPESQPTVTTKLDGSANSAKAPNPDDDDEDDE